MTTLLRPGLDAWEFLPSVERLCLKAMPFLAGST